LSRPDFRAAAARRLSEDRELSPAIISLLSADGPIRSVGVRIVAIDRIEPNPEQPRLAMDEATLNELASSIREHGVLQPILVRPLDATRYQLIAGERRWRASRIAGLETIPALVEEIDDDTALEISIIENLQREDLSPLDEAAMYDRMVREHGYSIRKLADKLGKDKGYLENRLRLADAPAEVRELVSLRKDTLSHAYELMKVEDPKKRRRLAEQVARGELTLAKLRDKIEGRRTRPTRPAAAGVVEVDAVDVVVVVAEADDGPAPAPVAKAAKTLAVDTGEERSVGRVRAELTEDSLVNAKQALAEAVDELVDVLRNSDVRQTIPSTDRANLAKYLTITKLKLENVIAMVRSDDPIN
jgi:ParB family chromosome partitioning protein